MERIKLVAFYLLLGGFSFGLFCILSPEFTKPPEGPIHFLDPKLEEALFAVFVPALPISIGVGLWLSQVRPRERAQEIQAMGRPADEARLQACIDYLGHALLDGQEEGALRLCEKHAEMLDTDSRLRLNRLYFMSFYPGRLPAEPVRSEGRQVPLSTVRLQTRIMALGAPLFLLMTPFVFFGFRLLGELFPGMVNHHGLDGAVFEAKACLNLSATAAVGWLGLKALLRRERRRNVPIEAYRDRGREVLLESCKKRLEWFLQRRILHTALDSPIYRLARASVGDALAFLDDTRKERLFLNIQECGLSSVINPSGSVLPPALP